MEFGSNKDSHDQNQNQNQNQSGSKRRVPEDDQKDVAITGNQSELPDSSVGSPKAHKFPKVPSPRNASAEVNMEVPITADEVIRAGGLGATDDISSILPGASDFTDLEDHLLEVQGYEESEDKISEGQSDVKNIDNAKEHKANESEDAFEAVNMEGSLTSEEFIRAGGFGATDNISNFLPVASDFTDFEAHIRDARDYEDLEEKTDRPGLGWTSETK